MTKLKLCLMSLLLLCSHNTFAAQVTGKIVDLISWHDGHTVIKLDSTHRNGCPGTHAFYSLGVKGKDIKAEPMMAVALAAYISDKTVMLSTSDGVCQGGEEKIIHIRLKK